MIEQALELAVVNAIQNLGIADLAVGGFWQPAAAGILKDLERDDVTSVVRVTAAPRRYDAFTSPKCEIQISIVLAVLVDRAPDGAALALSAEPIIGLLETWQRNIDSVKSTFTVDGFTPNGFRNDGGNASLDRKAGAWFVPMSVTVRGVITPTTPSSEEPQTQGATP